MLLVEELITAHVIAPVKEPTECATVYFVPKADRKKVRLVTDYIKLNKFVKRPVHPIPSLALDDPLSKIKTFLLPSGRFHYLRAPMGISSYSDEWCRHSDQALESLSFAKKIVDGILVWADDLPTLYDRIRSIATKCQDLNIVLSKKKFEIGTEIPFAGLMGSVYSLRVSF